MTAATRAEQRARADEIRTALRRAYPDTPCPLRHRNAFELLVATILSAQCTDERVNAVTPGLFLRYPDPAALAAAEQEELQREIYSTGFFRNKARNLIACAHALLDRHGGELPATIEELAALPGVGRKTANVMFAHWFRQAGGGGGHSLPPRRHPPRPHRRHRPRPGRGADPCADTGAPPERAVRGGELPRPPLLQRTPPGLRALRGRPPVPLLPASCLLLKLVSRTHNLTTSHGNTQ